VPKQKKVFNVGDLEGVGRVADEDEIAETLVLAEKREAPLHVLKIDKSSRRYFVNPVNIN
jgi:hypothetical protein